MPESLPDLDLVARNFDRLARNNLSAILRALDAVGLDAVAKACSVDMSTVSRWKEKDFKRLSVALSVLRLQVNTSDAICWPPEYLRNLRFFANVGINVEHPHQVTIREE